MSPTKGDDACHSHPWKITDVVIFPGAALALMAEWLVPTSPGLPRWLEWITGLALVVFGAWLVRASKLALEGQGQPCLPGDPTTAVLTSGVYAWSRNPNYVGALAMVAGAGLALDSLWVLAAVPVIGAIILVWMILPEERYLEERFGSDYRAYCARVRRWL